MTKAEYISGVLLRMNEAAQEGVTSVVGSDTTKAETFIAGTYADAYREAVNILPAHYFMTRYDNSCEIYPDLQDGTGYIDCPQNFLKLKQLKFRGWKVAAFTVYNEDDSTAQLQQNEFTRGSAMRPVVIINRRHKEQDTEGNKPHDILKYYSLPRGLTTHEIEDFSYISYPADLKQTSENTELFDITDRLKEPLMWLNAATVFDVFGKTDYGKMCREKLNY